MKYSTIALRFSLLPAIILVCFSFASCNTEKKYKIGISQCSNDDWRVKMNEEIEREILMHPEAEVEILSADDSNEKQIADLRYFAENDFDIIIVAPNEADAITPTIEQIYDSGLPVVVFDRNTNGNKYTAFQGADNEKIGHLAARYASNLLHGKGKVIEIYGLKGSTPAIGRHEGFAAEMKDHPSIETIECVYGNWKYDKAFALADSLRKIHPDVDLIYAHNDRMAIGASHAFREAGLSPYIIGIDAAPDLGIKAVKDSIINATFLYPTEGHRLIRTALAILKGEPYEKNSLFQIPSPVDLSNADILLIQNESLKEETSKMKELKTQVDAYWEKHSAQTTLLYICIALAILTAIVLFILLKAYWQRKRYQEQLLKQNELLAEQHERQKTLNEQLNVATQSKLAFFTNVSHDLRTPLTLISEPVSQLVKADNLTPTQHTLVRLADKNVRILRRLINQILDFRTFENGKLKLNLTEVDFGKLAREWADAFKNVARKRDIKLTVNIPENEDFKLAIDEEKMERICYNLLSNAIKYTQPNGRVTFDCSCDGNNLRFTVTDTGSGIPENEQNKIFDRFYQVNMVRPKGSGIGLSLVKAFVELHGGSIELESTVGKGSRFTVTIPVRHCEAAPDGTFEEITTGLDSQEIEAEIGEIETSALEFADDRPLILAIDDNQDILVLLRTVLGDEYNVITAPDGKTGLHLAARYTPDAILCDVMMPGIDGLECCRLLKKEVSTSHVPVLMLTACSDDEQRASGYDSGADGYLSKPFDAKVLHSRIASLIANRRLIRDLWKGEESRRDEGNLAKPADAPTQKPKSGADIENEFYSKFVALVEKEMGNPEMNVDQLASEMGLGRSQFYRKIKSLTNYSPVELVRNMRLKRARHLLTTTDKSISEIGYEVGFSTPAYFSKCYREAFGETPTDLRARL